MQVRKFKNLTLYGPHPLERDSEGRLKYHMADVFPDYGCLIVGRGLHVTLALDFIAEYAKTTGGELSDQQQQAIYDDLVALILRGEHLMVRSIPDEMEKCFRSAELLEVVVPAEMIRFTGRRDPKVREAFKLRGESWKMTPRYFTVEQIIGQLNLSMVSVATENRYYYKVESGGRLLTIEKLAAIGEALEDREQFRGRILEIVDLYHRRNKNYVREMDFFAVDEKKFDFSRFEKLAAYLRRCRGWGGTQKKRARTLFGRALENLRQAVPAELHRDDPQNPTWRNRIYSELNDIPPTEESILGISAEFNMNILWLPGCRISDGKAVKDRHIEEAVSRLIDDFFRFYGPLEYINLGRLMRSQSTKRAAGSYREVFIAVLRQKGRDTEQIRILRKVWRNVLYFLNRGFALDKANRLADGYLEYTFDRREILSLLGCDTPPVTNLSRSEDLPGIGTVNISFFNRPYIEGLATDKVSEYYYQHEGFVRKMAWLLGYEAGLNMIVGRSEQDSGIVYFGDGDEMFQFGADKMVPVNLVLADYTGAFADVVSPLEKFIPQYVDYLKELLTKIGVPGWGPAQALEVGDAFIEAVGRRILDTRQMLTEFGEVREKIERMAASRDPEVNPIRVKWDKSFIRLQALDVPAFLQLFRSLLRRRMGVY
ncbi:MAG: hypothetical protein V1794_14305 [Candidatus Glassbacteria bacterium]